MRSLASLILFVATSAHAQPAEPAVPVPAPAPVPCSERAQAARCECANEWKKLMATAGYPRAAMRAGLNSGRVVVSFAIDASGEPTEIEVKESTHDLFSYEVTRLTKKLHCSPDAQGMRTTIPIGFKLQ